MTNFWPIGAGSLKLGRLAGFLRGFHNFLPYKNGSKLFYDPLRSIPTHTQVPQIFEKNVIALTYIENHLSNTSSGRKTPPTVSVVSVP